MEKSVWKQCAVLALTAALLTANAGALFGRKPTEEAPEGPGAENVFCSTYQGVSCFGELESSGTEGVTFEVTEAPGKGTVFLEGNSFCYTPAAGAASRDRFAYVAVDGAGNFSPPATAEIQIRRIRSGVIYADLEGDVAAVAAQHLAEEGIFIGAGLGEYHYFEPDREVTRNEFLALALETVEREVSAVTLTGFCDDGAIPVWAKAYAAAGVADGIVKGSVTEEGNAFRGGDAITFGEAATVLNRVLGLGDVDLEALYAQRDAEPSWAAQAVANLEAAQVVAVGSFGSTVLDRPLSRGEAARMLSAVRTLTEN